MLIVPIYKPAMVNIYHGSLKWDISGSSLSNLVPSDVPSVTQNGHSLVRSTVYLVSCWIWPLCWWLILELVKSKCLSILLYGLECCNLRSADLHSLDFTYNRLFRTKSIDVVKNCQYFFRCCSPERSCPKESWQVGPKISVSRKRLLHILSLYLEFRYCCVN